MYLRLWGTSTIRWSANDLRQHDLYLSFILNVQHADPEQGQGVLYRRIRSNLADMKRNIGESVTPIFLRDLDGSEFDTRSLEGRPHLLSFFRFATCPFCNLRVRELVRRFNEFGEDFTVVAIFDSSLENLQRYAGRHMAPFPILADGDNRYYRSYGIERSVWGMLKGIVLRLPTLFKGMWTGPFPLPPRGNMLTMPADFLVDRSGVIRTAYYARDEGDHVPIEDVIAFSLAQ